MIIPDELLESLEGVPGFERNAFTEQHRHPEAVTSVRLHPEKRSVHGNRLDINAHEAFRRPEAIPWCPTGYYLSERPSFTFDPLFHAGCYYVQEASSMFLEQAVKTCFPDHIQQPVRVLDLCAAPGGKATHLSALFPNGLVVANEVIGSRAGILVENSIRWGSGNLVVTAGDASAFRNLEGHFDLILVDAPCSGSGMLRKDPDVIGEWSLQHVAHCSKRQQRILADVWPALKEGGMLVYATCSYSKEENETIADWICSELKARTIRIPVSPDSGIVVSESETHGCYGYRFYPYRLKGEGFYMTCFKKTTPAGESFLPLVKQAVVSRADLQVLADGILQPDAWTYSSIRDEYIASPVRHSSFITSLKSVIQVKKTGIRIGKVIKNLLIPDHELAVSSVIGDGFNTIELDMAQAIGYLQKKDIRMDTSVKGWCLVTYKGFRLGWLKAMPNRVNNYYPPRFRILKEVPSSL